VSARTLWRNARTHSARGGWAGAISFSPGGSYTLSHGVIGRGDGAVCTRGVLCVRLLVAVGIKTRQEAIKQTHGMVVDTRQGCDMSPECPSSHECADWIAKLNDLCRR